ncbi:MBL fold metallo-hydrolase [Sorangium cellulosum]|uniref:MBL fold metallo-hydrolase n=1 Tax=Sorangium cellulosum TaxID=56 RepID=A0A4P2Q6S5_SORCE|nr:MBL fold metallo-hydrolase [Sorangium cellulosum]AUX24788.1 MBL fold metallo-hydrolase [Sorangium cellulosum]
MARFEERLPENAPGDYFVDRTCIDCDVCRQIAPTVFKQAPAARQAIVFHQPEGPDEHLRAAMAMVSCPTASIGTSARQSSGAAAAAFPEPIAEGVYYCGYTSASSYGAASYLIQRPEGNVLVDSPRAARPLLKRIAELGGVRTLVLTHRDDVADHRIFHDVFGCDRVIHEADVDDGTAPAEVTIQGESPLALAPDLTVIPVPGHTRGSVALLVRERYLFTGDHLWLSGETGRLDASRDVCWHWWAEQIRSMERLLQHRFTWVLPGHGRRYRAPSEEAMRAELVALIERMKIAR